MKWVLGAGALLRKMLNREREATQPFRGIMLLQTEYSSSVLKADKNCHRWLLHPVGRGEHLVTETIVSHPVSLQMAERGREPFAVCVLLPFPPLRLPLLLPTSC